MRMAKREGKGERTCYWREEDGDQAEEDVA